MNTMRTKAIVAVMSLALAGCAGYRPIVDMQGVDGGRYESDLAQCQQYANQVSPATHAAAGAAGAAVVGGILGAIVGNRRTAGQGAAIYGTMGAAGGAAHGAQAQVNVVRQCMTGRGYRVLN